jgi:hypothetical protein
VWEYVPGWAGYEWDTVAGFCEDGSRPKEFIIETVSWTPEQVTKDHSLKLYYDYAYILMITTSASNVYLDALTLSIYITE